MSLQISIEAYLDDAPIRAQQAELERENEKITEATNENKKKTKEAFDAAMSAMRASYMMVSGITQVIGGDMGAIFSSFYGMAVAGITTYQSIAAAMAASGVGAVQAALMTSSLIAAMVSLGAVMTGQTELSRSVSGINMGLQGIGQSLSAWGL